MISWYEITVYELISVHCMCCVLFRSGHAAQLPATGGADTEGLRVVAPHHCPQNHRGQALRVCPLVSLNSGHCSCRIFLWLCYVMFEGLFHFLYTGANNESFWIFLRGYMCLLHFIRSGTCTGIFKKTWLEFIWLISYPDNFLIQ